MNPRDDRNYDRIHSDAEGTGCLILLLAVVLVVALAALAYWLMH